MSSHRPRRLDPDTDLDLVHGWVSEPRARFWGMLGKSRAEVEEIYRWIDEQEHLAAYLLEVDGAPIGLVQTYDPFVDEIGAFYDRRAGDVGVHLLLADTPARAGRTERELMRFLTWLAEQGTRRVVLEPDADNEASVRRGLALGCTRGPVVDLPHKRAQFLFLDLVGASPRI